ncbi:MAG: hypothetical protein AB1510_08380 [Bacillota bacterium]
MNEAQFVPGITGLGIYLPERVLANSELERLVGTSSAWIIERTGIRERRLAGPGREYVRSGRAGGQEGPRRDDREA